MNRDKIAQAITLAEAGLSCHDTLYEMAWNCLEYLWESLDLSEEEYEYLTEHLSIDITVTETP